MAAAKELADEPTGPGKQEAMTAAAWCWEAGTTAAWALGAGAGAETSALENWYCYSQMGSGDQEWDKAHDLWELGLGLRLE